MYPEGTLNQLERDPIVRWGCSWSELKNNAKKALLMTSIPFAMLSSIIPISFMFRFGIFISLTMISFFIVFRILSLHQSLKRADKPLFYDKQKERIGRYINPHRYYQRERNL